MRRQSSFSLICVLVVFSLAAFGFFAELMKVNIPEEYRDFLRIGTCSWKFDSWKGLYYESGKSYRASDYLLFTIYFKPDM